MSNSKVIVNKMILFMSKITKHKLVGFNYLDWSKAAWIYLQSINKDDYFTLDLPIDESRQLC